MGNEPTQGVDWATDLQMLMSKLRDVSTHITLMNRTMEAERGFPDIVLVGIEMNIGDMYVRVHNLWEEEVGQNQEREQSRSDSAVPDYDDPIYQK